MSHKRVELTLGDRGRLVLPAWIRTELGLTKGSQLLLSWEDGGDLRLTAYRVIAEQNRGLYADRLSSGSLVNELIAERRAEAEREP